MSSDEAYADAVAAADSAVAVNHRHTLCVNVDDAVNTKI